jgi:hypothetical protein
MLPVTPIRASFLHDHMHGHILFLVLHRRIISQTTPHTPRRSRPPLSDLIRARSGGSELYLPEPPNSPPFHMLWYAPDELSVGRRPPRTSWVLGSYTKILSAGARYNPNSTDSVQVVAVYLRRRRVSSSKWGEMNDAVCLLRFWKWIREAGRLRKVARKWAGLAES